MSLAVLLDTATEHVVVGLADVDPATGDGRVLAEETLLAPRRANEIALGALRDLMDRLRVAPRDIAVVIAGRGPGSFTGVRIGLATAKGLAHGRRVPLVAVPTLDAVAWASVARAGVVGIVGDAMRGEVYPMRYRAAGAALERLDTAFRVGEPGEVAARWAAGSEETVALAGNGLHKYADVFVAALGERALVLPEPLWRPAVAGLLASARGDLVAALADPAGHDPGAALPIYTRLSDAEEAEAARLGRAGGALPESGVAGPGGDTS